MEELMEFQVIWPENEERPITIEWYSDEAEGDTRDFHRREAAAPVSIQRPMGWRPPVSDSDSDSESESESEDMVPPHVLVARRWSEPSSAAAFSLCSGPGRTLKGRDLRNVRDFVLRMTGFLET
ncbi:uncharacterized protein LOC110097847 [Dendrobium catenatum]|uniref:Uncharacterized protein n=1 Tax=Dendrobium catenatum TaxID=906689 RepID=A0A2I0WWG4_9ASPA|nr:uncharacterized protein LOC110097847 [Dendrobium catenatum]PKU80000.1 hypothetical protein MA16_Dca014365 [Dendrobium catenatum]